MIETINKLSVKKIVLFIKNEKEKANKKFKANTNLTEVFPNEEIKDDGTPIYLFDYIVFDYRTVVSA